MNRSLALLVADYASASLAGLAWRLLIRRHFDLPWMHSTPPHIQVISLPEADWRRLDNDLIEQALRILERLMLANEETATTTLIDLGRWLVAAQAPTCLELRGDVTRQDVHAVARGLGLASMRRGTLIEVPLDDPRKCLYSASLCYFECLCARGVTVFRHVVVFPAGQSAPLSRKNHRRRRHRHVLTQPVALEKHILEGGQPTLTVRKRRQLQTQLRQLVASLASEAKAALTT